MNSKQILFATVLLLFLSCGCTAKSPTSNEIISENPNTFSSAEKNYSSESSSDTSENSEQSKNNYNLLGQIEEFKIYIEDYTDGTRFDLVLDEENIPILTEVPNTEFYVVDSNNNKIIEHAFDYCFLYSPDNMFSHPEYYTLSGSHNGNSYKYIFKDGKFEEYLFEAAGETGEELFGYRLTQYCWYNEYFHYGISDLEGKVVFEPIYTEIKMPFKDRFILGEGSQGMFSSQGEGRYLISDTEGHILAMYSYITYKIFDDGSYIGIASVAGGNSVKCYDKEGNILAEGYYFIDRDGNRISQKFESLSRNGENIFGLSSSDEMITAINENGKEIVFSVNDYICRV